MNNPVVSEFTSTIAIVGASFKERVLFVDDLSARDVQRNWLIFSLMMVTVGFLVIGFPICAYYDFKRDSH